MLETERKQNEKKQKKVRAIILRSCTVLKMPYKLAASCSFTERGIENEMTHLKRN